MASVPSDCRGGSPEQLTPISSWFLLEIPKATFGKVEEVKFISGSKDLKSAKTTWMSLISKVAIPGEATHISCGVELWVAIRLPGVRLLFPPAGCALD